MKISKEYNELQSCEDCVIIKTGTPISTKEIKICSVCGGKKKESGFDAMEKLNYNELNEKSLELEEKLVCRSEYESNCISVDYAKEEPQFKGDTFTLGNALDVHSYVDRMSDAQKEFFSRPIDSKYYVWSTPKTSYNWTWEIFKEFNMKVQKYKCMPIESA